MSEQKSTSSRHSVCQFSAKLDNFEFFDPNLPKNGFRFWNSKNYYWKKNQKPWDNICTNFQVRQTTLTFLAQICPKRKLGFEIQKNNVGIRISMLEIPCVAISRENVELWCRNVKNLSLDSESASLRYYVHQFSDKTDNFEFLGPNLPKNEFWGWNFKI